MKTYRQQDLKDKGFKFKGNYGLYEIWDKDESRFLIYRRGNQCEIIVEYIAKDKVGGRLNGNDLDRQKGS